MNGDPLLIQPEGARFIALGSAGAIFLETNGTVIKTAIKHDVRGCSEHVIEHTRYLESISEQCIDREKAIYKILPKHPRILDCLDTKQDSLHFAYHRLGNLRGYLQHNAIDSHTQDRWVGDAIESIALIHAHGVIHADISPRNFLVADDLSLVLCDFAGSITGELQALVEEEDRYRLSPLAPRSYQTDLFALGCLIYEICTGSRPYEEIVDTEKVAQMYKAQIFPGLNGLRYQGLIYKCWTSQYSGVDALRGDYRRTVHIAGE
ncbi:kinase-like protein [Aspergillus carlsbadensis]|nr:kinase-like protein [Aspergillus carlsbadensis]